MLFFVVLLLVENPLLWVFFIAAATLFFLIRRAMQIADYAYVSSRVRVMHGKMLGPEKISELYDANNINEVISSFEGTSYEQYVAGKTDLLKIEKALSLNLANDYRTIVRSCPKKAEPFFKLLCARYDLENIRIIIASKETRSAAIEFYPGLLSEAFLQKVNEAESITEIIELLKATSYREFAESLPLDTSAISLQKEIDRYIFEKAIGRKRILEAARKAGIMQDFQYLDKIYGTQADLTNLKIVLRCLRDGIKGDKLRPLVIKNGYYIVGARLEAIIEAQDINAVLSAIDGTPYHNILAEKLRNFDAKNSLSQIEKSLDDFWIQLIKSYYLRQPFGLTPIACYLALKETEILNIRAILNSIRLGLPKDKICEVALGV
ncbi:MAG: V-type ATPase subunit [Candidatus Diapherotrites archaeon]|nr:V-type ATPase subunit [Candidatus Diapherotrites archaeon]